MGNRYGGFFFYTKAFVLAYVNNVTTSIWASVQISSIEISINMLIYPKSKGTLCRDGEPFFIEHDFGQRSGEKEVGNSYGWTMVQQRHGKRNIALAHNGLVINRRDQAVNG